VAPTDKRLFLELIDKSKKKEEERENYKKFNFTAFTEKFESFINQSVKTQQKKEELIELMMSSQEEKQIIKTLDAAERFFIQVKNYSLSSFKLLKMFLRNEKKNKIFFMQCSLWMKLR
jgi:hypothetical protein